MSGSGIDISGLDEMMKDIDKALENFPKKRRQFHKKAGEIILRNVKKHTPYDTDRELHSTLYSKSHLRDALYSKVGSKGGYAAVRADYKKAPHTHLVNDGHIQQTKNGEKFVKGVHMFEKGLKESEGELIDLVEEFSDGVVKDLE